MIVKLAALVLLSAMSLAQTAEVPTPISLTVVKLGGNVTLTCPVLETEGKFFYWYKQPLGHMVQEIAVGILGTVTVTEQFKGSHFAITRGVGQYLLTISNVSKEDEATYFCQNGTTYLQNFVRGTFLAVNGCKEQKSVYVKQIPEAASIQLGTSMSLQCLLHNTTQCPGEHSVHWFRAGSGELHPGFIYTHSNRSDKQEERSCVYSLSKTIQNSSDAGNYYCAVVTCGVILFGQGTKVETRPGLDPVVLVLGGLLVCCAIVITILIFCVNRRVCEHCKGAANSAHLHGRDRSTVGHPNNVEGEAMSYAALNFSARKEKTLTKRKEAPQECIYSAVENRRAYDHMQDQPSS